MCGTTWPKIVLLTGPTGSSKSPVCKALADKHIRHIPTDSFYKDRKSHPFLRGWRNLDHPKNIRYLYRVRVLSQLKKGIPARFKAYSFKHGVGGAPKTIRPAHIILVEGIYASYPPRVRTYADLSIFLEFRESSRYDNCDYVRAVLTPVIIVT